MFCDDAKIKNVFSRILRDEAPYLIPFLKFNVLDIFYEFIKTF